MTPEVTTERKPGIPKNLKPNAHIHLMGICGTAMASLAGLLKSQDYKVTGSDQNVYPPMSTQLAELGIPIQNGYKKENLYPAPDLVIVGNVITRKFDETTALLESQIPFTSLPNAMGEMVIQNRESIVVAGTHGKTTTTAMNAFVAENLGLNPGFMVGGIPANFGNSFRATEGKYFIIEGDEYDTAFFDKGPKFLHYRPRHVILNSIEFDHADIYRDLAHVIESFQKLLDLIPQNGTLIACRDEETIRNLVSNNQTSLEQRSIKIIWFGTQKGDLSVEDLAMNHGRGIKFSTHVQGQKFEFQVPMLGTYNAKNALATFALWKHLGFPPEKILSALGEFKGVKRRQEILGRPGGVTIIEDFAHHPTAVAETINTLQAHFPNHKVFSVFEARSATSRRNVFQTEYAQAFAKAQRVLMPPPFNQAGIPEAERFSTDRLLNDLKKSGVQASVLANVDEIVSCIKTEANPGDAVLIMSNGGFDGIYGKLLKELER